MEEEDNDENILPFSDVSSSTVEAILMGWIVEERSSVSEAARSYKQNVTHSVWTYG
jgi:hypothetical protein